MTVLLAAALPACDPYERFGQGDDSLGPADPFNFPPANLGVQPDGTAGNRKQSGLGLFSAVPAFVAGAPVGYFSYAFPTPADPTPLRLAEDDAPYAGTPTSDVYAFDPTYKCTAPTGYVYDPRLDEVHYDQQGNIFTALPTASYTPEKGPRSTYVPVVSELPVAAPTMSCQQPKSEEALARISGMKTRAPSGRYLAYLVIDPGAGVYGLDQSPDNATGVGLQRWGWFNRYLVAYIDGGVIPTVEATVMEGTPAVAKKVLSMVTQKLYYPRSMVTTGVGATLATGPGQLGAGYDVLSAKRDVVGYSPVCEVFTYDAGAVMTVDQLPKDAATIEAMFNTMAAPLAADPVTPYVFCLQGAAP